MMEIDYRCGSIFMEGEISISRIDCILILIDIGLKLTYNWFVQSNVDAFRLVLIGNLIKFYCDWFNALYQI